MKLEKNEYTTKGFLQYLKRKFKKKPNGVPFTLNDVHQYCLRGYLPYRYGGHHLEVQNIEGIKIIKLIKNEKD